MKKIVLKSLYLLTLLFSIIMESCADDFPAGDVVIPEGEGVLSATVTFTPITTSNLGASRTDGDAIGSIESLCVLVYNKDKKLLRKYSKYGSINDFTNYKDTEYTVNKDKDHLDGQDAHTDETTTAQATFSLPDLPYGQYYIFAVANMEDLSEYEEEIQTVEGLQNIRLEWLPGDIEKNNQMFGYFTSADNAASEGFESDGPLTFAGKSDFKIHAWLKRAASKVTVAFDPSGLNQGVTIYIRNVTVRDIPKTCLLGAENTPTSTDDLYNYLSSYNDPDYTQTKPTDVVANSRLEYNSQGVITTKDGHTGNNSTDGFRLDNSIRSAVPADAHAVDAPSLFFYENMQGDFEKKNLSPEELKKYDKFPQRDGKDAIGNTIHDAENDKDFKDRVPCGTYVEVEAYYVSTNPANPGEGTIKYRFMLGKNIRYDYNAQRNYHYKLTLGFNGWANDPDWHIDYVVTTPSIEVPSVFRVSYLYQQKSELPIKIVGNIKWLTVTITENNWAPYDPNPDTNQTITLGGKEYKVPKSEITDTGDAQYNFKWNDAAFKNSAYLNPTASENKDYPENLPTGQQRPQFGFLALHMPNRNLTSVTTEFSSGANKELIENWAKNLEGERRFANDDKGYHDFTIGNHDASWGDSDHSFPVEDNKYTVNSILNDNGVALENQRILMLPVWTRTKNLIQTSGFSGNNPYEAFERKAVLHIAGVFDMGVGVKDKRIEKDVEVYQVKRITNPKGVWRAYDRNETFNVTLLESVNSNAESDFQPFISQGEWTAFIDEETIADARETFSIRPNGKTNGYMENGVIHGNTGSTIDFAITFNGKLETNDSKCAIVKVRYHGNQCMHKILVRKGYNAPLEMGNKKLWSSFALYQATNTNTTENGRQVFNAVLTKNPLMLGSMFRRGKQDQSIFVWNNVPANIGLGPFVAPNGASFVVGLKAANATGTDWRSQWQSKTWDDIAYRNDVTNSSNNLGYFYATDDNGKRRRYRVPTYQEFQDLTDNSDFGFGVFYGSSATEPKLKAQEAYGLIDPYNEGLFDDPNGMRAVVAYDKKTGNQILFPIGRYGIGVRRMFNLRNIGGAASYYNTFAGNLHYSDVYQPLINASDNNNLYRPIPYNLPIVSGCIYWIDQYRAVNVDTNGNYGGGCLGWDMNYFNFDFNAYTANNYADACPIKFVIDE